jgi:hypothetical protein
VLHAIHVLKKFPFLRRNRVHILKEIRYKMGTIYRATADLLDESLSFSRVMVLAALEPIFNV